jgi:PAS domain S-box-containing protein
MSNLIILTITLTSTISILVIAIKKKHLAGASSLILFSVVVTVAILADFFFYRAPFLSKAFWFAVIYLAIRLGYTAILTFVIQFTGHQAWLKPSNLAWLALEPALSQVLFWTNPGGRFFSSELILGPVVRSFAENPWFLVNTLYSNTLLIISLLLLVWDFSYRPLALRHQIKFILVGIAVSLLTNNNFSTSSNLPLQELKIISLLATGLAFIIGFTYGRIFDVTPITRESVVEHMGDGWIVLDKTNRIIDINAAAEKIIGISGKKLYGQPAEKIFIDWPALLNNLGDESEVDVQGSVQLDDQWTFLNIQVSPLADSDSNQIGKLIVWRDITERRLADEARQQARDEMFILLHSITSAASRALNLDDFLAESIYQIVYSSHSQSIAVYLLEESESNKTDRKLVLAAHHGIPLSVDSKMATIPTSLEIAKWVLEHGEPLLIPDIQNDERLPAGMREFGQHSLLLVPMTSEGQSLGFLGLSRPAGNPYTPDEIARLSAVTDEVATFIHSNRQRQLSIALAERQRLVRDLHDSVTQKLYGLVTLAEATQAGIQAGVADMPARMIAKMAENARQALKEMRLFLFQMQPVDFERDGLVIVLRNRLSAVEGRADITTRLTADENFSLPLEKELALYFIAQEALNNVLKHAKAKNVRVMLKNNKTNITLEIEDDGSGFDSKKMDSGGIGMKSMRERAAQIGGKLKISSTPGKGTKIAVSVQNIDWKGEEKDEAN